MGLPIQARPHQIKKVSTSVRGWKPRSRLFLTPLCWYGCLFVAITKIIPIHSTSTTRTTTPRTTLHRQSTMISSSSSSCSHTLDSTSTSSQSGTEEQEHNHITNNSINSKDIDLFIADLKVKYAHQPTFLQAVEEMALSVQDLLSKEQDDFYRQAFLVMTEPERIISFRVPWMNDQGQLVINRGWRVEFNSALGPYKGGLRFHPTVDEGILKFLGFEQVFKNALTGLPLGGGKGGSDFDPKNKSDAEIRRFCESFMTELCRYLHPSTDVPAGDIGVGSREIGYLYGQYKRLTNRHGEEGVLTGKSLYIGGSHLRPEATGYGLVYMTQLAVNDKLKREMSDLRCAVSGSGNVAQFAVDKLLQLGAKVITMSDSQGVLVFDNGMTREDWNEIMICKNVKRDRLSSIRDKVKNARYLENESPWSINVKYDVALPCATENEITHDGVKRLIANGVLCITEGANLPTQLDAQSVIHAHPDVIYIPGKAANAGGVGVSGLEMSQNAQRQTWTPDEVDAKLQEMMKQIYDHMKEGERNGFTFEQGANRAGFIKVARAMKELGWIY